MYADSDQNNNVGTDWLQASQYVLPKLYDDTIAQALGLVTGGTTGIDSASGKMRTMIAYSAIDEGTLIYGNTGIRAFYNDANDLGRLIATADRAGYLKNPDVLNAIGGIIAEYAGLLAINKDTGVASGNTGHEKGALYYDDAGHRLIGNFSHELWHLTEAGRQADVLGNKALTDAVAKFGGETQSSINQAVLAKWGGFTDNIVKLVAQTDDQDGVTLDAVWDAGLTNPENPTDGAMLVGGGGSNILNGASGDDLLIGGGGIDTFDGKGGSDLMFGGAGEDTFNLGNSHADWVDGGKDSDTATYSLSAHAHAVTLGGSNGVTPNGDRIINIVDQTTDGVDSVAGVETIKLVNPNNTVTVLPLPNGFPPSVTTIDMGATSAASNETLDFSSYGSPVYLSGASGSAHAATLYRDKAYGITTGFQFQNFNTLILSPNTDKVDLRSADDPYLQQVFTGQGDDSLHSDILNLKITLGDGHDRVEHAGRGSVINMGAGVDEIWNSDDVLVVGADSKDVFTSVGGTILHGATGRIGQESPWVTGVDDTRYGINSDGQLAIRDKSGATLYVADYHGGPDVSLSEQTGNIFVGLASFYASRLLDLHRPYNDSIKGTFAAGNDIYFAKTGKTLFNPDPLVLDLNRDGIHLTPESVASPVFDLHNTGFGVHSGWLQPGDGLLVYDKNGNGAIDSGRELFGEPGPMGFDALAAYDQNADGVIDANDAIYNQLQVWRDTNADAKVDPGELQSLAATGIVSIGLATTAPADPNNAGNTITVIGTFTRADSTTGTIGAVTLNSDSFHSVYLGDKTISTAAAAMPNLKGYGTLADLQVAMTLDPTLIDVVNANLPNLTSLDLEDLRAAAMPIFAAWTQAVPLLDADGNPQAVEPGAHGDIAIRVDDSSGTPNVIDFAYLYTDENDPSYWKLASGSDVKDAQGAVIAHPTFEQVMAQTSPSGTWQDFAGSEIAFMERYLGQPLPIDQASEHPNALLAAMSSFIGGA